MIELSGEERVALERRARGVTAPWREVQRARMILYAAEGAQDTEIAARLDCHPEIVSRWRARSCECRLEGLADKPRTGRPRRLPPEQVAEIKEAIACGLPVTHGLPLSAAGCWISTSGASRAVGCSPTSWSSAPTRSPSYRR